VNGQLQSRPSACPHGGEHPCWHLHKAACRGCSHSFIPSSPSGNLNISFHSLSYSIHLPVWQRLLPFCLFIVPRSLLVEAGGWRVGPTFLPGTLLIYYSFVIILLLPVRSPVFPLLGAFPALLVLSYEHCWWKLEVGGRNPTVPWALVPYLAAVTLYPIAHSSSVVHPASSSCVVFLLSSSRFLSLSCILLLVHPLVWLIAHSSLLALSFVILLLRLVVSSCFLPLSSSTMLSLLCYASCQCLLGIIVWVGCGRAYRITEKTLCRNRTEVYRLRVPHAADQFPRRCLIIFLTSY